MTYHGVQGLGHSVTWYDDGSNETGHGEGNHTFYFTVPDQDVNVSVTDAADFLYFSGDNIFRVCLILAMPVILMYEIYELRPRCKSLRMGNIWREMSQNTRVERELYPIYKYCHCISHPEMVKDCIMNSILEFFGLDSMKWCDSWRDAQHVLYQLANVCFLISYSAPSNRIGLVVMHSVLVLGFMLSTGWAWNVVCAPDVFFWNLSFMSLNLLQLFYVVYLMRPVKFNPELEDAYHTLFQPFKISRLTFKKLVSAEFAQIVSLHAGEAYAMQNLTRTDRLGLLLTGKVNVMSDHQFLHPILPCEFLDSPEFESSRAKVDEKFKVSIVAATSCRYLYWQRSSLEYLFVKETYLATVVTTLIAKDVATKLYAMNNKIITERGSHLDIRLPSITTSIAFINKKRSPLRKFRKDPNAVRQERREENLNGSKPIERGRKGSCKLAANGKPPELKPLNEVPASEDIVSWLDISSKYQSCEFKEE